MDKPSIKDFRADLKALLIKYDATIAFDCDECSDMHGVTGERIIASVGRRNIKLADGCSAYPCDL